MTTLSQFVGAGPINLAPKANGVLIGGSQSVASLAPNLSGFTSGANATNSYVDVVNYTGSGVLCFAAQFNPGSSAVSTLSVLIDGVEVINATNSSTTNPTFYTAIGGASRVGVDIVGIAFEQIPFRSSLQVRHKTNSGTVNTFIKYRMNT